MIQRTSTTAQQVRFGIRAHPLLLRKNPRTSASTIGQTTLEVIIALTLLTIALTSAALVVTSGQSLSVDSQESSQALRLAQRNIESMVSSAKQDFLTLASSTSVEGEFTKTIIVTDIDDETKQVVSRVSWSTDPLRTQTVELTTLVTNWQFAESSGGDTGGGGLVGDWSNPRTLGSVDLGAGISGTDLDVVGKIVYMTGEASSAAKKDFFVIDATDGENPVIIGSINTTNQGLLALDVAGNYAYAANNTSADDEQLQVIDISSSTNPVVVAEYTLPGNGEKGISIFYYNQRVYIGTEKDSGPEFFVVDVSTPTSPVSLGSKEIGDDVSAIRVNGNLAYIATPSDNELTILNVADPASITVASEYNVTGSCEDGLSEYLVGTKLYFGREDDCGHEDHHKFFILNVSNASSVSSFGSTNIGADVNDLTVRDTLAFLATSDSNKEFQVWNISNPASPSEIASFNFPQVGTAIDYEDNLVYVAVRSNDALRIITSQ
ncbi:MAG: hypothetical protein A2945_01355 [Candidatus Liptonbacteria bacterium RIFCSPLOWO2_01_FULL_52_25]|uniref:LVIVD repeat protein n=1 Tax=Candidatus Liptonbacteria bacterium RIFCSPLOWO2_01_FULL_52_25 TaxID=1798650 RepID=A0A1G2CGE7_9BACT|nr:MAG: hypothetical protein A2945_01355 [Candidatus Liptonbacteria bacterium RIFCSPLOWO2_01_FULL_52_25]